MATTIGKILILVSLLVLIAATFGVATVGPVTMLPLGLALFVAAHLIP